MTLKQQLKVTQIVSLMIGIVMVMFLLSMINRIKQLEQERAENYIRIEKQISELNKKVHYAGG